MSIETFVQPMRDHRAKLDGDTASGSKAADAFSKAGTALTEAEGTHEGLVRTALGGWYGQQAGLFQDSAGKVKSTITALATNTTTASTVASTATAAVTGGRTAIDGLISEFIAKATPILEAAQTAADRPTSAPTFPNASSGIVLAPLRVAVLTERMSSARRPAPLL